MTQPKQLVGTKNWELYKKKTSGNPAWRLQSLWTYVVNHNAGYTLIAKYAKMGANAKKEKCIARYFAPLFRISHPFFRFLYFAPGSAFTRKVKEFCGLFFRGINKTRNSHKMRNVYSECFIFCGVFCEKHKKCEKCIAGLMRAVDVVCFVFSVGHDEFFFFLENQHVFIVKAYY